MREADGVAGCVNNTLALHPFLSQNPAEPIVNVVSSKKSLLEAQRGNTLLKKQISQLEEKLTNMMMVDLNPTYLEQRTQ